jgi:hypothetical protein
VPAPDREHPAGLGQCRLPCISESHDDRHLTLSFETTQQAQSSISGELWSGKGLGDERELRVVTRPKQDSPAPRDITNMMKGSQPGDVLATGFCFLVKDVVRVSRDPPSGRALELQLTRHGLTTTVHLAFHGDGRSGK